MLGPKVLNAKRYPVISAQIVGDLKTKLMEVVMSLRGQEAKGVTDFMLSCEEGLATATAAISFQHKDFGLKPYATLFGLIRVAEPLDFHFSAAFRANCSELQF